MMNTGAEAGQSDALGARYRAVRDSMASARDAAPLAVPQATLIAASKQQPLEKIKALLALGHRDFGENRIQEAKARWPALRAHYPDMVLHFIGALQTNKAATAVTLCDVIHTLDRDRLAAALAREAGQRGCVQRCLIQVNIGEEPQKSGVYPSDLAPFCARCRGYGALEILGLMAIPPPDKPPAPYFALMRRYQQSLELPYLSLGMSGDYETALRFGATHIRLGTALFGPRP